MSKPSIFIVIVLASAPAWAGTRSVTCTGDITSAMNDAISASGDGDIVSISAGTCSMDRLNSINDTNLIVQGAGKALTLITANSGFGQIISNGSKSPKWQLKGFTLSGSTTNTQAIVVWGDAAAEWRGPFLISDVELKYPNNTGQCMAIFGPIYGVITGSKFTNSVESAILTGLALTDSLESGASLSSLKGAYAASLPYQPGAANYLYIEDCTFVGASPNGIAAIDTGYTGGRIVFRHNTLNRATLYSHWTTGSNWNSLWWEIYDNTFIWDGDSSYQPMRMQGGGTGLIYDNTIIGFGNNNITIGEDRLTRGADPLKLCASTNPWDGNTDLAAPGWPCLTQTGRNAGKTITQIQSGSKQESFPLYVWNNGKQAKCSNPNAEGPPCDNSFGVDSLDNAYFKSTPHSTNGFGNGDVDWCKSSSQPAGCGTHTLTYSAYAYPHPPFGDAGAPSADAGHPDAGHLDAGGSSGDAGAFSSDAGTVSADAGTIASEADAGVDVARSDGGAGDGSGPITGGCNCATSGGVQLLLVAALILLRRRQT